MICFPFCFVTNDYKEDANIAHLVGGTLNLSYNSTEWLDLLDTPRTGHPCPKALETEQ